MSSIRLSQSAIRSDLTRRETTAPLIKDENSDPNCSPINKRISKRFLRVFFFSEKNFRSIYQVEPITVEIVFSSFRIDRENPFSAAARRKIFPPAFCSIVLQNESNREKKIRLSEKTHIGKQPNYSEREKEKRTFSLFSLRNES